MIAVSSLITGLDEKMLFDRIKMAPRNCGVL